MIASKDTLFLASQSASRKHLLSCSDILFKIIGHTANEEEVVRKGTFHDYVLAIARQKMQHIVLPVPSDFLGEYLFVLTADSLTYDKSTEMVFGKPKDMQDARRMLTLKRDKVVEVATACCLEKKVVANNKWVTADQREWVSSGEIEFNLSDQDIESYLANLPQALHASGAGIIEDFGLSFLKSVRGSYTAILGLPLYELRQALRVMHFKF